MQKKLSKKDSQTLSSNDLILELAQKVWSDHFISEKIKKEEKREFSIHLPRWNFGEIDIGTENGKNREEIIRFMKGFEPNKTLEERFRSLDLFVKENFSLASQKDVSFRQIMSRMMMFDMLLSLVSNFRGRTRGNIVEGFLAGMLGENWIAADLNGKQIGVSNIVDVMKIDSNEFYSVKFLEESEQEKSSQIEGSVANIIDFFEHNDGQVLKYLLLYYRKEGGLLRVELHTLKREDYEEFLKKGSDEFATKKPKRTYHDKDVNLLRIFEQELKSILFKYKTKDGETKNEDFFDVLKSMEKNGIVAGRHRSNSRISEFSNNNKELLMSFSSDSNFLSLLKQFISTMERMANIEGEKIGKKLAQNIYNSLRTDETFNPKQILSLWDIVQKEYEELYEKGGDFQTHSAQVLHNFVKATTRGESIIGRALSKATIGKNLPDEIKQKQNIVQKAVSSYKEDPTEKKLKFYNAAAKSLKKAEKDLFKGKNKINGYGQFSISRKNFGKGEELANIQLDEETKQKLLKIYLERINEKFYEQIGGVLNSLENLINNTNKYFYDASFEAANKAANVDTAQFKENMLKSLEFMKEI